MLRSLFNELWLYLGSTVGVKRNYSHKRRRLKILFWGKPSIIRKERHY